MTNGCTVVMTCLKPRELCLQSRPLFEPSVSGLTSENQWIVLDDLLRGMPRRHRFTGKKTHTRHSYRTRARIRVQPYVDLWKYILIRVNGHERAIKRREKQQTKQNWLEMYMAIVLFKWMVVKQTILDGLQMRMGAYLPFEAFRLTL